MCLLVIMGRMQIVLSDIIEKELREKAFAKYGLKKGAISKAVEEATSNWIKQKK